MVELEPNVDSIRQFNYDNNCFDRVFAVGTKQWKAFNTQ